MAQLRDPRNARALTQTYFALAGAPPKLAGKQLQNGGDILIEQGKQLIDEGGFFPSIGGGVMWGVGQFDHGAGRVLETSANIIGTAGKGAGQFVGWVCRLF